MIILIVDDSNIKVSKIKTVVDETVINPIYLIAQSKAEAMEKILANSSIDLMILDLNLPNRAGENAKRLAGLSLLNELNKRTELAKPNYIIGLTAYKDIQEEVEGKFTENGWVLVTYDPTNTSWEETIRNKALYIEGNNKPSKFNTPPQGSNKTSELALVMKGGGIKGLAYVGALEELSKFYNFDWYAGTSAGAISAILLGAGYDHEELSEVLKQSDFNKFKDSKFFFDKVFNLLFRGGLYHAETFTLWMQELLSTKLESGSEVKLENLKHRVSVYASTQGKKALIYDSTDPKTKETPAAFAARCSMSIPLVFIPQQNNGYNVFDGGTQNNYPVEILLKDNPNTKFIGLYLGDEYFRGNKKKNILSNLISIWTESNDNEVLEKYKNETIIIDPKPISTLQFSLNEKEKEFLLECGRLGALKFLKKNKKIDIDDSVLKTRIDELENKRVGLITLKRKKNRIKKLMKFLIISVFVFLTWFIFFRTSDSPNYVLGTIKNLKESLFEGRKIITIKKSDLSTKSIVLGTLKTGDTLKIIDAFTISWSGVHNCGEESRINNEGENAFKDWQANINREIYTLLAVDSYYKLKNVDTRNSIAPFPDNSRSCNSTGVIECWLKLVKKDKQ
tara:strand:- start:838 stop:2700 length:1863 start_codon:yes stop_codon:yes gene_type:complete